MYCWGEDVWKGGGWEWELQSAWALCMYACNTPGQQYDMNLVIDFPDADIVNVLVGVVLQRAVRYTQYPVLTLKKIMKLLTVHM